MISPLFKHKLVALAAGLGISSALVIATVPGAVSHARAAAAEAVSDLLNKRSPGERFAGMLLDSKRTRPSFAKAFIPAQSPPSVISPDLYTSAPADSAPFTIPPGTIALPSVDVSGAAPGMTPFFFGGGAGGGLVFGGRSGGSSGGGGGGGGGGATTTPPPTLAAVPENATWVTLIAGFGAIGAVTRRRRGDGLAGSAGA